MGKETSIEWCDSTITPLYGCSKVSPACANCYAERLAARFVKNPSTARLYAGTVDEAGHWTGKLNLFPERMEEALRWKKPRRIFVASQSDLFHEDVPDEFLDTVFWFMAMAPQHTFLLLTKRAKRMHDYISMGAKPGLNVLRTSPAWPLPNVHIGVTVEDQKRADERIPWLLRTPAALRFVSCEPLLGMVDLENISLPTDEHGNHEVWSALDWQEAADAVAEGCCGGYIAHVISGCESGPNRRHTLYAWLRSLRDQCAAHGTPYMCKQAEVDGVLVKQPFIDGVQHLALPETNPGQAVPNGAPTE